MSPKAGNVAGVGKKKKKIQLLTAENVRVSGWGAGSAQELSDNGSATKCPDIQIYFNFFALFCCVPVGRASALQA